MSDMWTTASEDVAAEEMARRVAAARVATVDVWPFLSRAENDTDYANRKAIVADRLDSAVAKMLPNDPVAFSIVRATLESTFDDDYRVVAQVRKVEALRAEARVLRRRASPTRTAGVVNGPLDRSLMWTLLLNKFPNSASGPLSDLTTRAVEGWQNDTTATDMAQWLDNWLLMDGNTYLGSLRTKAATYSDEDKAKIMGPKGTEITPEQAQQILTDAVNGGYNARVYGLAHNQIVSLSTPAALDAFSGSLELIWQSKAGVSDLVSRASNERRVTASDFPQRRVSAADFKTADLPQQNQTPAASDATPDQGSEPSQGAVQRRVDQDPDTGEFVGSEWAPKDGDPNTLVQTDATFNKNPRFKTQDAANAWAAETDIDDTDDSGDSGTDDPAAVKDTTKPDPAKSKVPEQFQKKTQSSVSRHPFDKTADLGTPEKCAFCDNPPTMWSQWLDSSGKRVLSTNYYCNDHSSSAQNWSGQQQSGSMSHPPTTSTRKIAETNPPYYIEQQGGKWVVVNDEGKVKGTFDTKDEARAQQSALYANVPGAAEKAKEDHGDPKPSVKSSKTAADYPGLVFNSADGEPDGRWEVIGPDGNAAGGYFQTRDDAEAFLTSLRTSATRKSAASQVVYQGTSADQVNDAGGPTAADLEPLIGKPLSIVFYNEYGVAADYESGQITAVRPQGNGDVEFDWDRGEGYAQPTNAIDVYKITQNEQATDPAQMSLFSSKDSAKTALVESPITSVADLKTGDKVWFSRSYMRTSVDGVVAKVDGDQVQIKGVPNHGTIAITQGELTSGAWNLRRRALVEATGNPYGDANPYMDPAPATAPTTAPVTNPLAGDLPTTTRPAQMPTTDLAPAQVPADMIPDLDPLTSSLIPVICRTDGQRFAVAASGLTESLRCACGSADLDLDESLSTEASAGSGPYCSDCFEQQFGYDPDMGDENSTFAPGTCANCGKEGIVFTPDDYLLKNSSKTADVVSDPPADLLGDVDAVQQNVTCSTCLTNHVVTATDPAQPMPACPNCGALTLSPAGATLASRKRAKVAEIMAGIRETNPGMDAREAMRMAKQTIQRFPQMIGN